MTISFQIFIKIFHQECQENSGSEMNGTYQFLVYADDVNLLSENINMIRRYKIFTESSELVSRVVNSEKTTYMLYLVTRMQGKL
jgi:hypothetical protein